MMYGKPSMCLFEGFVQSEVRNSFV